MESFLDRGRGFDGLADKLLDNKLRKEDTNDMARLNVTYTFNGSAADLRQLKRDLIEGAYDPADMLNDETDSVEYGEIVEDDQAA